MNNKKNLALIIFSFFILTTLLISSSWSAEKVDSRSLENYSSKSLHSESLANKSGRAEVKCPRCNSTVYNVYYCPNEECKHYKKKGCRTIIDEDDCLFRNTYLGAKCRSCGSIGQRTTAD